MRKSAPMAATVVMALAVLGLTGCRTRPNPESCLNSSCSGNLVCDVATERCVPPSIGDGGGPADGDTDGSNGGLSLTMKTPAVQTTYTNRAIAIEVELQGAPGPTSVDILKNDTVLSTVSGPYAFNWDTTQEQEGPYQISARATINGQLVTATPVTVVVDRTPPQVMSRTPGQGAIDVPLADPILVSFSEPLDPGTVTASAITLVAAGGAGVQATSTLSPDGTTITVALRDRTSLSLPATISESVDGTIADLAGNAVVPVGPWSWNAPLWLKLGALAGQYPSMVLDPQNHPIVCTAVEQGAVGSNQFLLQVARHQAGSAWDTSFGSPQGPQASALVSNGAAVGAGRDGNPILAWSERPIPNNGTPASIHVAKWTGAAWDARYGALDAILGSGTDGRTPSLAVGPSDELFVAWVELNTQLVASTYAARWAGTSWDTSLGGIGVTGTSQPVLRLDASIRPAIGWNAGGVTKAGVSRWSGSQWTTTMFTSAGSGAVAIDSMDRPVMTAITGMIADMTLGLAQLSGGQWIVPIPAIATGQQPREAQIAIDPSGAPIVAWTESDGIARNVRVARFTGVIWDVAYGQLSAIAGANTDASWTQLILDASGLPVVAWQEVDGSGIKTTYVWKSNH